MSDPMDVSAKPDPPRQSVVLTDIDVPIGRIAVFLLKVMVVSFFFGVVLWLAVQALAGSGADRYGP